MSSIFSSMRQITRSCISAISYIPSWLKQQLYYLLDDIKNIRYNLKNLSSSNMNLGVYHLQNGNFRDAIFRFKLIEKFIDPSNKLANYWLGWAYLLKGDYKNSIIELTKSGSEDKINLLDFVRNIDNQKYIPTDIYKLYRDLTSQSFINKFHNIPEKLVMELNAGITNLPQEYSILELGGNIGLVGNELQKRMQEKYRITNLEISSKMLDMQKLYFNEQILYDEIINMHVEEFLKNKHQIHDIIISLDGLSFTSALDEIFSKISSILKPNGYFAAVFKISDTNNSSLQKLDFAYNTEDILSFSRNIGFETLSFKEINLEIKNNYAILICRKTKPMN